MKREASSSPGDAWYAALGIAIALHSAVVVTLSVAERRVSADDELVSDRWIGEWMELGEIVEVQAQAAGAELAPADTASSDSAEAEPGVKPAAPEVTRPVARRAEREGDWMRSEDQLPTPAQPRREVPGPAARGEARLDRARADAFAFSPSASSAEEDDQQDAPTPSDKAGKSGTEQRDAAAPGVRNLATAFTRAVPVATDGDAIWRQLAAGGVGSFEVTLQVDGSGSIVDWTTPGPLQPHFKRLLQSTLHYLEKGRFAVTRLQLEAGSLRLGIEVTLSDRPLVQHTTRGNSDPTGRIAYGFQAPAPRRPGKAWFQYGSGRYFEARVSLK